MSYSIIVGPWGKHREMRAVTPKCGKSRREPGKSEYQNKINHIEKQWGKNSTIEKLVVVEFKMHEEAKKQFQ